ncbi:MAG: hypothetical protein QF412_00085 [Planctomycetota bacterium]|jgi:hypothetical protein|nr:hypothetical protein [Planctomycetota bacterium]
MRTLLLCLRMTMRGLALPLILLLPVTWGCLYSQPPLEGSGEGAALIAGLWLHLPAFTLSAVALITVLKDWPLFSRDQPGAAMIRRLRTGPLDGCLAAAAGAAAGLLLALIVTATAFQFLLGLAGFPPINAHDHVNFSPVSGQELAPGPDGSKRLRLQCDDNEPIKSLRLRPLAALASNSYKPAQILVHAGADPLTRQPVAITGSRENLEITFPPRSISTLDIEMLPGSGLLLTFGSEAVEGVAASPHPPLPNAMVAAASYLWPFLVVLACCWLGRRHLSRGVSTILGLAGLLLLTLLGLTPHSSAIAGFAEGRWLGYLDTILEGVPSFLLVVLFGFVARFLPEHKQ